jgi:hypothetical protein
MNFRTGFFPSKLTCIVCLIIIASCGSHKQKGDEAFDLVKKEKMLSNDSDLIRKALIQEKTTSQTKKNEPQDKWTIYKVETEKKIQTNENTIREIRTKSKSNANLIRKVSTLEKENNNLRIQMDKFNDEMTLKLENFKNMMNNDVNDIGIQLKVLKTGNK